MHSTPDGTAIAFVDEAGKVGILDLELQQVASAPFVALSEPLYVFFSLLSLGMLASHIRQPRWTTLLGAALLCGAGVLTRYAGWALVPAGVVHSTVNVPPLRLASSRTWALPWQDVTLRPAG